MLSPSQPAVPFRQRPLLAITMGDPAGIGPEIIVKALQTSKVWKVCRPVIVGSQAVMAHMAARLKTPLPIMSLSSHTSLPDFSRIKRRTLPIYDPLSSRVKHFPPGRPTAQSGAASVQCIQTAVQLALDGHVAGIVTAPINKQAMHLAGYAYPGHTELLADLTQSKTVGMMILGGPLKIMFTTTHLRLGDVPQALTPQRLGQAIRLAHRGLRDFFKVPRPTIGVAALNPHAGEGGIFGHEERTLIAPAVKRAQRSGIHVSGPFPADTLFGKAARGEYDAIVAMYHDQGLIPLKLLAFGQCVNMTLGLPILRTSVDHGTAYDIVGTGTADPQSLIEAITLAARLGQSR